MISYLQWLLSRGNSKPLTVTSSPVHGHPTPKNTRPCSCSEHGNPAAGRELGQQLTGASRLLSREIGLAGSDTTPRFNGDASFPPDRCNKSQKAGLSSQWAAESGESLHDYLNRMHSLAANMPRYIGLRAQENDK